MIVVLEKTPQLSQTSTFGKVILSNIVFYIPLEKRNIYYNLEIDFDKCIQTTEHNRIPVTNINLKLFM